MKLFNIYSQMDTIMQTVEQFNEQVYNHLQGILNRIAQIAVDKRKTMQEIDKDLMLASSISAKKSKNNFGTDLIVRIAIVYPEINLRWLILGEGTMYMKELENYSNVDKIVIGNNNENESVKEITTALNEINKTLNKLLEK